MIGLEQRAVEVDAERRFLKCNRIVGHKMGGAKTLPHSAAKAQRRKISVRKQSYYGAIALLALLVGALAVTNQSLWIDEGVAALKAMEPTLGGWWHNCGRREIPTSN